MGTEPHDGTIFAVWCHAWNKPDGEPRIQFAQWLDPHLTGGKLCAPWDYNNRPFANGWLPIEVLNVFAQAIEAQRAETTKIGSVACDESAVATGDAPNLSKDSPGISTPIRGE